MSKIIIGTDEYNQTEYTVNEKGEISYKWARPSGQWTFTGIRHIKQSSWFIPFKELTPERVKTLTMRFKNGNPCWRVQDVDHGTTRLWGSRIRYLCFED